MMKRILLLMALLVLLTGCSQAKEPVRGTEFALGTVITLSLLDHGDEALLEEAFDLIEAIEDKMSTRIEGSDIWRINHQAGEGPVPVTEETLGVILQGMAYGDFSKGSFDISMGPIVDLWQIGSAEARLPEPGEIEAALEKVDYRKITVVEDAVGLESGMSLDLGAIAKGYAADQVAEFLRSRGVTSAVLDLGGNIKTIGARKGGEAFRIGIRSPFEGRNDYFGIVSLVDKSVVSSGDYERYFEEDGKRYHHIFDAVTGYPVETEVAQVTVITEKSMEADALSTTFYTLSVEEGIALADTLDHVCVIYVTKDFRVFFSQGAEAIFELTDPDFILSSLDNQ